MLSICCQWEVWLRRCYVVCMFSYFYKVTWIDLACHEGAGRLGILLQEVISLDWGSNPFGFFDVAHLNNKCSNQE